MGCCWSKQLLGGADQSTESNQDVKGNGATPEQHAGKRSTGYMIMTNSSSHNLVTESMSVNSGELSRASGDLGVDLVFGDCVRLELIKDDILNLKNTNSIVNFIHQDDIYGRLGIIPAAGDAVKQQYDTDRHKLNLPHVRYGVVMTTAGNLPYKAIFHVKVFEQSAKFENAIYKALQLADRKGMRSIALPALSSKALADSCIEILYEYEKSADPIKLSSFDRHCY